MHHEVTKVLVYVKGNNQRIALHVCVCKEVLHRRGKNKIIFVKVDTHYSPTKQTTRHYIDVSDITVHTDQQVHTTICILYR